MKKFMIVIVISFLLFGCVYTVLFGFGAFTFGQAMKKVAPSKIEDIDYWLTSGEIDGPGDYFISWDVCRNKNCDGFQTISFSSLKQLLRQKSSNFEFPEEEFQYLNTYRQVYTFSTLPFENINYEWDEINCALFDIAPRTTSDFGARGGGFHGGKDFGLNLWSNVYTPVNGVVTYADFFYGWGPTLVIENNGYSFQFSHAGTFEVEVGDYVNAGDLVITSGGAIGVPLTGKNEDGSTWVRFPYELNGNSTGGHLHFEIRECHDGKCSDAIDPDIFFADNQYCIWDENNIGTSQDRRNTK